MDIITEITNPKTTDRRTIPVRALNSNIAYRIIESINKDAALPTEYAVSVILFVVSVLIGNKYEVRTPNAGIQSSPLYLLLVGPAGTGKSPIINILCSILYKWERMKYNKWVSAKEEQARQEADAKAAGQPFTPIDIKYTDRYLSNDLTQEAINSILGTITNGFGIIADEILSIFADRYGGGGLESYLLTAWMSGALIIDRKKDGTSRIDNYSLSILGGTQTAKLSEFTADGRDKSGLFDRFLYAMPTNNVKPYPNKKGIDQTALKDWELVVERLIDIEPTIIDGEIQPIILEYNKEAENLIYSWVCSNIDKENEEQSEAVKSIYSKLNVNVHRIALVIQLLMHASHEGDCKEISVKAASGAIELIEYFRSTALEVRELATTIDPLNDLTKQQSDIYNALPERFKTGEAVAIAISNDMSEITFKRWLNSKKLFTRISHGVYSKSV